MSPGMLEYHHTHTSPAVVGLVSASAAAVRRIKHQVHARELRPHHATKIAREPAAEAEVPAARQLEQSPGDGFMIEREDVSGCPPGISIG